MSLEGRAKAHAALGDERRLLIVDLLATGDRTVVELAERTSLPGNLLAHHLDVLEGAGLVERRVSEGDRRRRYVVLRHGMLRGLARPPRPHAGSVLFVCSHNSARSQYAAARWAAETGQPRRSAGRDPAPRVHPLAVKTASELGIDLSDAVPGGYDTINLVPDLLVSVCDRARESELPVASDHMHWSVPDPVEIGTVTAFRSAFREIDERIGSLSGSK